MEKYLLSLIRLLMTVISPNIREALILFLDKLEADAKETVNEWDDFIVALLRKLLIGEKKNDFNS